MELKTGRVGLERVCNKSLLITLHLLAFDRRVTARLSRLTVARHPHTMRGAGRRSLTGATSTKER
jgi:hypothetical protein